MTLGTMLRQARKAKGMTILAVCNAAIVSEGYLSKLEKGQETRPSREALERLAAVLDLDPDMLEVAIGRVPQCITDATLKALQAGVPVSEIVFAITKGAKG